jgi:hypothetical protein
MEVTGTEAHSVQKIFVLMLAIPVQNPVKLMVALAEL